MAEDRRVNDERLVRIETKLDGLLERMKDANLVNRVGALERRQAYLAGAFAAVTAIIAAAKALGLLG